jgi:carbon storage regulator
MLVLTRRKDESIVIGDEIIVTILAVEGDKVKLGIDAPRRISVLRRELWVMAQQNSKASPVKSPGNDRSENEDIPLDSQSISKHNHKPASTV